MAALFTVLFIGLLVHMYGDAFIGEAISQQEIEAILEKSGNNFALALKAVRARTVTTTTATPLPLATPDPQPTTQAPPPEEATTTAPPA